MCGFIGYICKENSKRKDEFQKKFNFYFEKQIYRGPDYQEKISLKKGNKIIQLGFNRLSILDISNKGNQIFKNDQFCLLFNGEILNFKSIKEKYFQDTKFYSNTDTEVLFNFLIKFKTSRLDELEGMFAFVLIDFRNNEVIFCKDFTGIKPLYYLMNDEGIFFSSDANFLYSITDKELNYESCKFFFQFGFTPKEDTLIKNVKKLPPSSYMQIDLNKNNKKINKYYEIQNQKNINAYDEDDLRDTLLNVIKKNLISDTKTGIFLSGGLDSSILSVVAKKINPEITAYTSFFSPKNKYGKFNKDVQFAEKLCKDYNIKLNKVIIDEENTFQKNLILSSFQNLDEPIANLNFFNSFLQSKQAREENCKVILTGDGADEIFGGYERYQKCMTARKFRFLSTLSNKVNKLNSINNNKLPEYFYNFTNFHKFEFLFSKNFQQEMHKLSDFNFNLPNNSKKEEIINYFDLSYWLSNESNFKLDRASMFNSIEARVPFQDISLIKKYFKLKFSEKIDLFNLKKPLKKLNIVPKYINNRKKHGWFSPESFFLRGYLKEFFLDMINSKENSKEDIFNKDQVLKLFENHLSGNYYKNQLIPILTFKSWYNNL